MKKMWNQNGRPRTPAVDGIKIFDNNDQATKHYCWLATAKKMGGQGQCSDSADRNKILIIAIQAAKCSAMLITFCTLNCDY